MKLDNKFAAIRTNILMMQPLPTIFMAYKLLVQEEKQRQTSQIDENLNNKPMVFAADYRKHSKNHFQGSKMTFQSTNGNKLVMLEEDHIVSIVEFLVILLGNVTNCIVIPLISLKKKGRRSKQWLTLKLKKNQLSTFLTL